jgi:transmembrane sensor
MTRQEQIEEAASYWLMRKHEPDWSDADEVALALWLDEFPAHKAAFWRLDYGWTQASQAIDDHRRRSWWRFGGRVNRLGVLAASFAVLFLATGAILLMRPNPVETVRYSTGRGLTSTIWLADGSKIELNTDTSIRLERSGEKRVVWIDTGEAYFDVAHDDDSPFVVHAGQRKVVVLGTRFQVARSKKRLTVSVVEGRVRVSSDDEDRDADGVIARRGDIVVAAGSSTLVRSGALDRIERSLQWRRGMIVFDDAPLGSAVEEFNRYNRVQMVIDDMGLAAIRVGGSFETSNADGFVRLLQIAYDVEVERDGEKIILKKNRY